MNKNTIIGITIIGLIFIGFSVYNSKIARKQAEFKRVQDSLASVQAFEQAKEIALMKADSINAANANVKDTAGNKNEEHVLKDKYATTYSNPFLEEAHALPEEFYVIENEKLKITYTTRGAQPWEVLVKGYLTSDSTDLYLIKKGASSMGLQVYTNQYVNTDKFTYSVASHTDSSLAMRLYFSETAYIEHEYILPKNSYLVNFNVNMSGMDALIARNASQFDINWKLDMPRLEKGYDNEKNYSTVYYKYPGEKKIDNLGKRKDTGSKSVTTKFEWFAFQQQFFSAIMVADNSFSSGNIAMKFYPKTDAEKRLMACSADVMVQYDLNENFSIPFKFYYGPNHYKTLKSYKLGFEKIVPLGGWLVVWINRFVIIPLFDFFSRFIHSYGLIILLLTLVIKLLLSPLTFKSYMSSAKMNVLKPEIDKINAKYPKQEDALKKQQATMDLYKKAGVSMFGGCLPMLLQFPILFAMFRFFPSAFELRQQSFLWVHDLSTYDSIWDYGISIPLLGNHLSLFALLCALTMYLSSKITQGQQMENNPQMKTMKFMTLYFMPIFMFFICNNLSSALTYYYFLSNVLMILQTVVIRKFFVDEKKIMEKIRLASVKGAGKPKSKFQKKLEELQKAQQEAIRQQQRRR